MDESKRFTGSFFKGGINLMVRAEHNLACYYINERTLTALFNRKVRFD